MKNLARLRAVLRQTPLASLYRLRYRIRSTRRVFTDAYRRNIWADPESVSGPGSNLTKTRTLRARLPLLLEEFDVRTLLDAPCGDFNWMKETSLSLEQYIGVDIVKEIIRTNIERYGNERREFLIRNIIKDDLPRADLILCRDALVHFPYRDALKALGNFKRSGSRYLLTTTFVAHENEDLQTIGLWRPLNLQRPPFNLPPPTALLDEGNTDLEGIYSDKSLGLWELSSL